MAATEDLIADIVGIAPADPLAEFVAGRADIMDLTQKSHDAAITPGDPGGLSHAERAALACRISRLNGDRDFQVHFERLMRRAGASEEETRMADPQWQDREDERRSALVRHVDLVAARPRDATEADIRRLQAAGLDDADIVRLSELVAFVSYQIRVAAGLRLMQELA